MTRAPSERRAALVAPSVFGAFDGVVTMLGAVFGLAAHPHALVTASVGLAAAGAVSMAGGQFLSDNEHGLASSAAIGVATGAGTLTPALPYMFTGGFPAGVVCAALCVAVGLLIVGVKIRQDLRLPRWRALTTTFGLMFAAAAFTLLCTWATGAVG